MVMHFKLRFHCQDPSDREFALLVARPVQWGASLVVNLVDIEVLVHRKVEQADWLVALGCDVEAVGAIDICHMDVGAHLVYHQSD